jgi:hypothetical protein
MRLIGLTRCCASVAIWLGGQIVDATVIEGRRPRLNAEEKVIVRAGGMQSGWFKARARQIDRDGRWAIKRGRKQTLSRQRSFMRTILRSRSRRLLVSPRHAVSLSPV